MFSNKTKPIALYKHVKCSITLQWYNSPAKFPRLQNNKLFFNIYHRFSIMFSFMTQSAMDALRVITEPYNLH